MIIDRYYVDSIQQDIEGENSAYEVSLNPVDDDKGHVLKVSIPGHYITHLVKNALDRLRT